MENDLAARAAALRSKLAAAERTAAENTEEIVARKTAERAAALKTAQEEDAAQKVEAIRRKLARAQVAGKTIESVEQKLQHQKQALRRAIDAEDYPAAHSCKESIKQLDASLVELQAEQPPAALPVERQKPPESSNRPNKKEVVPLANQSVAESQPDAQPYKAPAIRQTELKPQQQPQPTTNPKVEEPAPNPYFQPSKTKYVPTDGKWAVKTTAAPPVQSNIASVSPGQTTKDVQSATHVAGNDDFNHNKMHTAATPTKTAKEGAAEVGVAATMKPKATMLKESIAEALNDPSMSPAAPSPAARDPSMSPTAPSQSDDEGFATNYYQAPYRSLIDKAFDRSVDEALQTVSTKKVEVQHEAANPEVAKAANAEIATTTKSGVAKTELANAEVISPEIAKSTKFETSNAREENIEVSKAAEDSSVQSSNRMDQESNRLPDNAATIQTTARPQPDASAVSPVPTQITAQSSFEFREPATRGKKRGFVIERLERSRATQIAETIELISNFDDKFREALQRDDTYCAEYCLRTVKQLEAGLCLQNVKDDLERLNDLIAGEMGKDAQSALFDAEQRLVHFTQLEHTASEEAIASALAWTQSVDNAWLEENDLDTFEQNKEEQSKEECEQMLKELENKSGELEALIDDATRKVRSSIEREREAQMAAPADLEQPPQAQSPPVRVDEEYISKLLKLYSGKGEAPGEVKTLTSLSEVDDLVKAAISDADAHTNPPLEGQA